MIKVSRSKLYRNLVKIEWNSRRRNDGAFCEKKVND